jgi:hypothetical protein
MADTTVDVTKAPAKILSVTELANGKVFIVTEEKAYEYLDGKLRPIVFADVEYEAVKAKNKLAAVGAAPAAPPPPAPVEPIVAVTPGTSGGILAQPALAS